MDMALLMAVAAGLAVAGNSIIAHPVVWNRNYYPATLELRNQAAAARHRSDSGTTPATTTQAAPAPAGADTTHAPADTGRQPGVAATSPVSGSDSRIEAPPAQDGTGGEESTKKMIGEYELIELDEVSSYASEEQEFAIIVDARKRATYEEGHIPGAYSLDYYRLDAAMVNAIRPQLEAAAIVVLYCNGGNCEDSLNLAASLVYDYGIDRSKLRVFEAGYEAWIKAKHAFVVGAERR
jgi:rhodanese-related sulfurtransferase